jgi:hypothetical protein
MLIEPTTIAAIDVAAVATISESGSDRVPSASVGRVEAVVAADPHRRNFEVVLSARTLPPVWQVGQ